MKDIKIVFWYLKWMGINIDVVVFGKIIVGVVKVFGVMCYVDLRIKFGVFGKLW